ncbi:MAG TPA: bacillithiol system redox-active protein YtxJ [Rhodothermales bacterium]|nr:bacillithiol system redox-active protein YtxJ [Rhodothermales bacterium]
MDQAPLFTLNDEQNLEAAVIRSHQEPVVIYKHSMTCGVSFRARREIERLTDATDPPVYEVIVQRARPLSRQIAQRWRIRHESPQVIVLYQGEPIFNASHRRITAQSIRTAIQTAATS